MPNLLDIDPSILERNLLFKELQDDSPGDALFNIKPKDTGDTPWKPVKPNPGYCVKLRTLEGDKVFVNVCHTDGIPEPMEISEEKLLQMIMDDDIPQYRIPISIGDLHIESDKSHNPCSVYDIAVNSNFFKKMDSSEVFNTFFMNVSIQGLQEKYNLNLDLKSEKPFLLLKNRKVFGNLQVHRIQQREVKKAPGQLIQELSSKTILETKSDNKNLKTVDQSKSMPASKDISCSSESKTDIKSPTSKNSCDYSQNEKLLKQPVDTDTRLAIEKSEKGIREINMTKDSVDEKLKESFGNELSYTVNEDGSTAASKKCLESPTNLPENCSGIFCIKQVPENGYPQLLIASVRLNVKSSRDFNLELDENRVSITLVGSTKPWFDITLPYHIDVNKVEACFITEAQRLMIKLDVM